MFKSRGKTQETAVAGYEDKKVPPVYEDALKTPGGGHVESADQAAERGHAATDA